MLLVSRCERCAEARGLRIGERVGGHAAGLRWKACARSQQDDDDRRNKTS
jgi:hypothetical protein